MATMETINATEFKAKCLDILDRISRRQIESVTITKRGRTVAVLIPPVTPAHKVEQLHGFLRGSVVIPAEVDLTAPISDQDFAAETGVIHE
jgi:prevent-host-death family protein